MPEQPTDPWSPGYRNQYFGKAWDSPFIAGALRMPTPVGERCPHCGEEIALGDQGIIQPLIYEDEASGEIRTRPMGAHRECLLLGIVGHLVGTCYCHDGLGSHRERGRETIARIERRRRAWMN